MPKYSYFCEECENKFNIKHGLRENYDICILCKTAGFLKRIPSNVFINTGIPESNISQKTGEVVNNVIKDAKEELKEEKERLKKRMYKNE